MIKIDLITGFLGSGKTTFIKKYAKYLIGKGEKIGILENDFGAVNVDMMLLQELQGDNCNIETVAGACDADCHKRRFKTKLIAMAMSGYDRVIIEPSGIFDTDEFFDTLREEPLDRWYESGNVIAIADSRLEEDLSENSEYLLTSQIANAGTIILSRVQETSPEIVSRTVSHIRKSLENFNRKNSPDNIIIKDWNEFSENDFEKISLCGYVKADFTKRFSAGNYSSVYFMNSKISVDELKQKADKIFKDKNCGNVFRIKGFIFENNRWFEINATEKNISVSDIRNGQEIIIIIGENLVKENISKYI